MTFTMPTRQRARVAHTCSLCGRRIDPGEVYERVRGFDGGDAWTCKTCAHCDAVVLIYDPTDWGDDGIGSDDMQGWVEDRGPRTIGEARAMAGYRMAWRARPSQRLLPVPQREPIGTKA